MEPRGVSSTAGLPEQSESKIFRKYYTENDYFVSVEGILKILSAVICVVSSVLFLSAGACASAPALLASTASVALACGVLAALLYAGVLFALPLYAPQAWLYTDIVVSTVMGVLLLLTAVLNMTICDMNGPVDYIHGPLSVVSACMVTGSAALTYAAAMRAWDRARAPRPPRPPPAEHDA